MLDVGAVALTLEGRKLRPSRVAVRSERPAPVYFETVVLRTLDRHTLAEPRLVTFSFRSELGGSDAMQLQLGELRVDGRLVRLPPVAFSREGQFVSYRLPRKQPPIETEDAGLAADL